MMPRLAAVFLAFCAVVSPAAADTISGRAVVVDGDTLVVAGERIRLLDIDAPEADQPMGDEATEYLKHLVAISHTPMTCEGKKRDRYRRLLAHCRLEQFDVGLMMVAAGLAVPYRTCRCPDVRAAADEARAAKRGVWAASEFTEPWVWRKQQ